MKSMDSVINVIASHFSNEWAINLNEDVKMTHDYSKLSEISIG